MTDFDSGDRIRQQLEFAVKLARRETLQAFVRELMIALAKENYRLDDLLDALTVYSQGRGDWSKVFEHLIAAAKEVREAKKKLTGK
jgi:hypothetical protein